MIGSTSSGLVPQVTTGAMSAASSVTTGDDAQGQASLTARVDGVEFTGSGTSTDIVEASAHAWLEVANRAVRARVPRPVAALA